MNVPSLQNYNASMHAVSISIESECKRILVQPVVDAVMEAEGCQSLQDVLGPCSVNEMGERCSNLSGLVHCSLMPELHARTSRVARSVCMQALQTLNQTAGCCINLSYNSSAFRPAVFTYEFWSDSGLQTPPGECEVRLNGAVQPQAPGIPVVILLMTHLATLLSM